MTNMLRIDPAYAPLWRDAHTLQFGLRGHVTLTNPTPWHHELISALLAGVPQPKLDRLAAGLDVAMSDVDAFIARIASTLITTPTPIFARIAALPDVPDRVTQAISSSWAEAGGESGASLTIVVAAHVLTPRNTAALMSEDAAFLPIVFGVGCATVGPLTVPGRTACTSCLVAAETSEDMAWPALAAQLASSPFPEANAALIAEAATLALRLARHAQDDATTRSVVIDRDLHRTWRRHLPHADCGCQFLAETAMESVAFDRSSATSSNAACPVPA